MSDVANLYTIFVKSCNHLIIYHIQNTLARCQMQAESQHCIIVTTLQVSELAQMIIKDSFYVHATQTHRFLIFYA